MKTINKYRQILETKKVEKNYILNEIHKLDKKKEDFQKQLEKEQMALAFLWKIALKTQNQLEFKLSDMVTAGLNSVFDQEYAFVVKFEQRRDKTECDLFFQKHGKLVDPLCFSGLGAADIAAFALRCASWSMVKTYRNTLLLDEPFKHLKGKTENKRVLELMKMLSEKLQLQIICINDERADREDIIRYADTLFEVKQNLNGESKVKKLK